MAITEKLYDQKISTIPAFLILCAQSHTNSIMPQQAIKQYKIRV
jgi:hypothetical protein